MPRLPNPGGDNGNWGTVLNDFLKVEHNTDGTHAIKSRQFLDAKTYGAIGDGVSHPLSQNFSTLSAAQAVYPHATALTDETDWAAIQGMLNAATGGVDAASKRATAIARVPAGRYVINRRLDVRSVRGFHLIGEGPDLVAFLVSGNVGRDFISLDGLLNSIIEGFTIEGFTGSAPTCTNVIHLWWQAGTVRSTTNITFKNIFITIEGSFQWKNSFAVEQVNGNQQNDDIDFYDCVVRGYYSPGETTWWQNGFIFGTNVTGNTLDIHLYGCASLHCQTGVNFNSSNGGVHGFQAVSNGTDFHGGQPTGQITINDVRSEGAERLFTDVFGTVSSRTSFNDIDFKATNLYLDGIIIYVNQSGMYTIKNMCVTDVRAGTPPKILARTAGNDKQSMQIVNLAMPTPLAQAFETNATCKLSVHGYSHLNADGTINNWYGEYFSNQDVIIETAAKGLVLKDSQAIPHYWRIKVSPSGALSAVDLGTTAP